MVLILFAGYLYLRKPKEAKTDLDAFAKCLRSKNVTMYGASWCSHCANQKEVFGKSFTYVPYVECPADPKTCIAKGVELYPTWIFPDGHALTGEQTLQKLSAESGCAL